MKKTTSGRMDCQKIIEQLKQYANPKNVEGMVHYGINPEKTLGVNIHKLREIAKAVGKDHALALELWNSGIHEARILAGFVDRPSEVTESQMDAWVMDFDSWDICDGISNHLFDKTPFAYDKAIAWCQRPEEYVRRAGFVLMATLAVHDKKAPDEKLAQFFPYMIRYASDERNFVKKAVNWALRQLGKRNVALCKQALAIAAEILTLDSKAARWIARDAIRELEKKLPDLQTKTASKSKKTKAK